MAEAALRFDHLLMNMAGQAGSLEALLAVFFSFLHRNTDFYVTYDPAKTAKAGMGFPPGKAEQLLLRAFHAFPDKPYTEQNPTSASTATATAAATEGGKGVARTPAVVPRRSSSKKAPCTGGGDGGRGAQQSASTATKSHGGCLVQLQQQQREVGSDGRASEASNPRASETGASPPQQRAPPAAPKSMGSSTETAYPGGGGEVSSESQPTPGGLSVRYTEDGKQVPIGNGGVTPRYYWTQTVSEATVYVDVPVGTRSKDVSCVIEPRRLRLSVRGAGAAAKLEGAAVETDVVIDGELQSAVSREDSMWSLSDGKTVVISFEKATRSWWSSVVEGDPEIDTTKVDSTCRIHEYDEETQGTIRKIMFDQRQKALGLPTSDQLSADAVLERAKILPGSPFLPGGAFFGEGGVGDGLGPDGGDRKPK